MKKVVGFLLLIFGLNTASAQILSLNDLIKINSMSFNEYHAYAVSKRYKLSEMEDDEKVKSFSYAYGQNKLNLYATRVVTKYEYKNSKKHSVILQTLTSGDYYNITNQVANQEFQLISSKAGVAGMKSMLYRKGKNEISLIPEQGYNPGGNKIIFYQIQVSTYK